LLTLALTPLFFFSFYLLPALFFHLICDSIYEGKEERWAVAGKQVVFHFAFACPVSHAKEKSEVHSRGKSLLSAKEIPYLKAYI